MAHRGALTTPPRAPLLPPRHSGKRCGSGGGAGPPISRTTPGRSAARIPPLGAADAALRPCAAVRRHASCRPPPLPLLWSLVLDEAALRRGEAALRAPGGVGRRAAALPKAACAALRNAVDAGARQGADTVDGHADWQINIDMRELTGLIGVTCTDTVLTLPSVSGVDDAAVTAAAGAVPRVFVRRYTAATRPWIPFHYDLAAVTVNIALCDDGEEGDGGVLVALYDGGTRAIVRKEGDATVHSSSLLHGVTRVRGARARYSLIAFFGAATNE